MKRPLSVTILGVFVLIHGSVFIAFAGASLGLFFAGMLEVMPPEVAAELPTVSLTGALLASATLVMGLVSLVSGVGILLLRQWAWLMAMIAQGINLAAELIDYTRGEANYLSMLASVIIVLYLNMRDIRRALSAAQHHIDPASVRTAQDDQTAVAEIERELVEQKYKDVRQ